jgi:hypothetical protein
MFYQISLLLLLLAGRASSVNSYEVINNGNIDQRKHPDVLRLIVSNSSAKVNLRGPTSASPSSSPSSRPSICATVNEGSVATISCPSSTFVGAINFASYGTPTGSCGAFSNGSCDSINSMPVVKNACLSKATCTVDALSYVFGYDPCFGTPKRLYIQAVCNPIPFTLCATVAENSVATISCPSGTVMRTIDFASYGTPTGSCGAFSIVVSCVSRYSMSVVMDACLNKETCTVSAQNSVFGDPCPNTLKRLYIQATCAPAPIIVCASVAEYYMAFISCPSGTVVRNINFASYGTPTGSCGAFSKGSCDSTNSMSVVTNACLNKGNCVVFALNEYFGDPCPGTTGGLRRLSIQATCDL